jgi:tRNA pseudouridine synthase 8/2,5-diamino-6-(5-phospho-D-ribitylamino)-pyrimidin-4(3H)-one deaminase
MHRHEPPISADPVEILFRNECVLVVNKPGSVPVHPTGRYHYNTLVEMLKRDLAVKTIRRLSLKRSPVLF